MLSYVIPAPQESENCAKIVSPQRNLSLNLVSPSVSPAMNLKDVDMMLANVPTERTRLLGDVAHTPPPARRQNMKNNNNSSICSSNFTNPGAMGGSSAAPPPLPPLDGDEEAALSSDEVAAETTATGDSDISDRQHCAHKPTKKSKLAKVGGSKSVGLKRVSFGSSKGSMVETLVFETPTPLSEHAEPTFAFESDFNYRTPTSYANYSKVPMDDSGIEVQEESERSIVRVSIYQSNQPQQICAPEYLTRFEDNLDNTFSNYNYNYNLEDIMTAASTIPGYDRQQSTDSGWDNPFRPGGDLSREADEIVSMIRGGKPITPTEDHVLGNGSAQRECNGNSTVTETVTKTNVTHSQSAQNGTNSHRVQTTTTTTTSGASTGNTITSKPNENSGASSQQGQVSKQVVPGPTSASHVVIDEKKSKKKGCCVVQ